MRIVYTPKKERHICPLDWDNIPKEGTVVQCEECKKRYKVVWDVEGYGDTTYVRWVFPSSW